MLRLDVNSISNLHAEREREGMHCFDDINEDVCEMGRIKYSMDILNVIF